MQLPVSNTPDSARSTSSSASQYNENDPMTQEENEEILVSVLDNLKLERKKSIIKTELGNGNKKRIKWDETVRVNYTNTYYRRNPNSILTYNFWSHSMSMLCKKKKKKNFLTHF